MNILFLCPYVPSLNAYHAGGVVMAKNIEILCEKHNVYLMSFINNEKEEQYSHNYSIPKYFYKTSKFKNLKNVLLHLDCPNMFALRTSLRIACKLIKIVKEYSIDVIHAEYTAMGQYVWIKKFFPNIKFNLVEHDVVQQSYRRYVDFSKGINKLYYYFECLKVAKKEKKYCTKADIVFVNSDKDKELVENYYGLSDKTRQIVFYSGVDISYEEVEKENNSVCFVGQMARKENKEAALRLINIFNALNNKELKLYIIGANPDEEIRSKQSKNVIITGFVDDINAMIKKCKIAVFPLMEGAGIKIKVLQALSLGVPVITTSVGAEGIDEEGKFVALAETDKEFEERILEIMNDDEKYSHLVKVSKDEMQERFDISKTKAIFEKVYCEEC